MWRLSTLTLVAASLISTPNAINLQKRTDGSPRVIQHDIQRKHVDNPLLRDRIRRRDTVSVSLENEETLYFANVSVGTPAQELLLHLDTGSSDLWVNTGTSSLCTENSDPCSFAGTYAPNKSSTYSYVNSLFNISYVDGSGSAGDYVTDTVSLGGVTLENQMFGIGYTSSSQEGIIGIGYTSNEALVQYDDGATYANVPKHMMQSGLINTNAYSLWLNDLDASTGSILFGGVNTEKFHGTLSTVPIIQEDGIYAEFIIALTAIGMNGNNGSIASDIATAALLDSGSSLMYLPNTIAEDIFTLTGAEYDQQQGAAFVDCSMAYNDTTLDFTFSGATISVSMSELVIVAGEDRGQEICIIGIGLAEGTTPVLGDTFLRSAYVVYDLSNNEISLAQTNFNSTTNNIVEITNSTGVPDATGVASAVTSVATSASSDGARIGGNPSVSAGAAAPMVTAMAAGYGAVLAAAGAGFVFAL
ncbi:hypothetical protein M8818_006240 [Zalaria obscura]|uniref:Uncharacterized protein n=1 Tax=Zalaria obscura TaxID=2024903 RepID=A0ACC3S944_9PEZI